MANFVISGRNPLSTSESDESQYHARDDLEISLVDCGINRMIDLSLKISITSLNLHFNNITQIEGIKGLVNLKHLDLSANRITRISGIESLMNLRTLNLSSNKIRKVEGLKNLNNLVRINLSFNQISDLSGFAELASHTASSSPNTSSTTPQTSRLTSVFLQGNQIRLMASLLRAFQSHSNLRQLTLNEETFTSKNNVASNSKSTNLSNPLATLAKSNPICHNVADWRLQLWSGLSQLAILDGVNRQGERVEMEILADIAGLENYVELLCESSDGGLLSSEAENEESVENFRLKRKIDCDSIRTQRIDQALQNFEKRPTPSEELRAGNSEQPIKFEQTDSKENIENQKVEANSSKAANDSAFLNEDELKSKLEVLEGQLKVLIDHQKTAKSTHSRSNSLRKKNVKFSSSSSEPQKNAVSADAKLQVNELNPAGTELKRMNLSLGQALRQYDTEQRRRIRAELACRKLMENTQELQSRMAKERDDRKIALEAVEKLKEAYHLEGIRSRKLDEIRSELQAKLKSQNETMLLNQNEIDKFHTQLVQFERDKQLADEKFSKMESEIKTSGHRLELAQLTHQQELEVAKIKTKQLQLELDNVNSKWVQKEQEFQNELSKRFSLDSNELQVYVKNQMEAAERNCEERVKRLNEKLFEAEDRYEALENEFRFALRVEQERYNKIKTAFDRAAKEAIESRSVIKDLTNKEIESRQMVSELSQIVKEQKMKLTETGKAHSELNHEHQEQISKLERQIEAAREKFSDFTAIKNENKKLVANVQALESVIDGLRSERRLWSDELVHQGSELAQDRGRLETKIEIANQDISRLNKQLENEVDAVKIKTKLIEDQTDTIGKLKQGLKEKDAEIKRLTSEALSQQQKLEADIENLNNEISKIQIENDQLLQRKKVLKTEIISLNDKLDQAEQDQQTMKDSWTEKSELIGQLEQQMSQVKQVWHEKEANLNDQLETARDEAKTAMEKLASLKTACVHQIESVQQEKDQEINRLRSEIKMIRLESQRKIENLESEMRQILSEFELERDANSKRVRRLQSVMSEMFGAANVDLNNTRNSYRRGELTRQQINPDDEDVRAIERPVKDSSSKIN